MNTIELQAAAQAGLFRRVLSGSLIVQFMRYLVVGGLAFVVDFGLLFVLTDRCHVYYLVSAAISFLAGTLANYALSIKWVFDTRAVRNARVELALFALIGIVGLGMNVIILWGLSGFLHWFYLRSKLVSTCVVLLWNFSARKLILFS